MARENTRLGGQPAVVMTPMDGAQAASEIRRALEQAGWRVIVAPNPGSYVSTAHACLVIFSPETTPAPEISAAISAGFTTLIPLMTAPMPVPYARWAMPPVPLGTDPAQRQRAAAIVLAKLTQVTPGVVSAPSGAISATPPMTPMTPMTAPSTPTTPAAPPLTPDSPPLATAYAPPAPSVQPLAPGYPQSGYAQPYGQLAGYPTSMPKSRCFPGWLRTTLILVVVAALLIGGYVWSSAEHVFSPNALSGQWRMSQTINGAGGGPGAVSLSLAESGTRLTGAIAISPDGGGASSIPLTGTFIGQSVVLHGSLSDPSGAALAIDLTGVASSDDQMIQGTGRYALSGAGSTNSTISGPFTALRVPSGNGVAPPRAPRALAVRRPR